jgi:hypothetical protein
MDNMLEQEMKQNDPLTRGNAKSNSVGDFSRLNSKGNLRSDKFKRLPSDQNNQQLKGDFSLSLKQT